MGFAPPAAAITPATATATLARIKAIRRENENVSVIGSEQCDYSRGAAKFTGENNP
jgi:hypothetical protein